MNDGAERPYWVDAREWTDEELTTAARRISTHVERGSDQDRSSHKEHCEFLFALSRSDLPEIRGNYYWPSAYKEVVRRNQTKPARFTQQRFEKFFRDAIYAIYLRDVGMHQARSIHHKFIAVIFQQAGIGKNRSRIFKEFLQYLVEKNSLKEGSDVSSIVHQALEQFVDSLPKANRADVDFLSGVLTRTGVEILCLAHALEHELFSAERFNWQWRDFRKFWIARTGVDLEQLTPSAEQILRELLSNFSMTWSRREIFRLAKIGKIGVVLPGQKLITDCRSFRDIPIGPADVTFGGTTRTVIIVDHASLDPEVISIANKDILIRLDDEYAYKVSSNSFDIQFEGNTRQHAVPYFVGSRVQNSVLGGYFWGGYVPFGVTEESIHWSTEDSSSPHNFRIQYAFGWRSEKLLLRLGGFRASFPDTESSELTIGGLEVWKGPIGSFRPQQFSPKWIDVARLNFGEDYSIEACILPWPGEKRTCPISLWPLLLEGFLVVGRRIYRPEASILLWQRENRKDEIHVFFSGGDLEPELHNLVVTSKTTVAILDKKFWRWSMWPSVSDDAEIRLGRLRWEIEYRREVDLSYVQRKETDNYEKTRGEVSVLGVGNISVVEDIAEFRLGTSDLKKFDDARLGLWVGAQGEDVFCSVIPGDWSSGSNGFEINVASVMQRNGIDPEAGANQVVVGTNNSKSTKQFNFFLLPESFCINTTHFCEPASIAFGSDDQVFEVRSEDRMSLSVFEEKKPMRGKLSGHDWDIWFKWKPVIYDVTMGGKIGSSCNYTCALAELTAGWVERSLICRLYSTREVEAEVVFLGENIRTKPAADLDLLPFLLKSDWPTDVGSIDIRVIQGQNELTWSVGVAAEVTNVECIVVSDSVGHVELAVRFNAVVFRKEMLMVSFFSGSIMLGSRELILDFKGHASQSAEVNFAVLRSAICEADIDIVISHRCFELIRKSFRILSPVISSEVNGLSLESLIGVYQRTSSLKILPLILEASIRLVAGEENAINSIKNVMPRIGGRGDNASDEWMLCGLKSLEYLAAKSARPVLIPSQAIGPADLCVTSLALWLLLGDRLAAQGILVPDDFSRGMKLMKIVLSSGALESSWAGNVGRLVFAYATGLASRYKITLLEPGIEIDRSDLPRESEAAASVGAISMNFRNWLETI